MKSLCINRTTHIAQMVENRGTRAEKRKEPANKIKKNNSSKRKPIGTKI